MQSMTDNGDHLAELPAARVRELLAYEPETGVLRWKRDRGGKARIGTVAGRRNRDGYIHVQIDRRSYKAHRLAWVLTFGDWPRAFLDHVNGQRDDNRIANLREATRSQNNTNSVRPRAKRPDLPRGVRERKGRFCAMVTKAGRKMHVGTFSTAEEASAAYRAAAHGVHGEFLPQEARA